MPRDLKPGESASLHERRVHRMLTLGCGFTLLLCSYWGALFALHDLWAIVPLDVGSIALALWTLRLVQRWQLRRATYLLSAVMYGVMTLNAGLIDLPTPDIPRSAHSWLLGYALMSVLLVREEPPWLRHGVPLLFLVTWCVFASLNVGTHTILAIPEEVRRREVWTVNVGVALLIYAALWVIQADLVERDEAHDELKRALLNDELQLHFQPQVDPEQRVIGAEALARWQHPQRGLVSPVEFIPLAERCGLMPALGDWVLRSACLRLAAWSREGHTAQLQLAVNVSASQFAQPDFVDRVLTRVHEAGIDPRRLKLELTESLLAHDVDAVATKMAALKAQGIGFSLDDFGTGFSSLNYLRRLPLDQLKIDQTFVRNMLESPNDAAIAQTVVALGRTLGLEVIAEGVETAEQRDFLAAMGCEAYQGYLFSRPLPAGEFAALVACGLAPRATPP